MDDDATAGPAANAADDGVQIARRAHGPRRRNVERGHAPLPAERHEACSRGVRLAGVQVSIDRGEKLVDADRAVTVAVELHTARQRAPAERDADADDRFVDADPAVAVAVADATGHARAGADRNEDQQEGDRERDLHEGSFPVRLYMGAPQTGDRVPNARVVRSAEWGYCARSNTRSTRKTMTSRARCS